MPRHTATLPLTLFAALLLATLAPNTHAAPATPAWPDEEGREAWDKLGAFYADPKAVVPWKTALRQLDSPNPTTATRAGNFLVALLAQSFADETNGRARWESFVGFGYRESSKSAARDFRRTLAAAFGKSAKSPAALSAVRWLVETELVPESQESGMTVLCRISTPEADALLLEQLAAPHPNAAVLLAAINETGKRQLGTAADPLAKLCLHPRSDIRLAAGAAYLLLPVKTPQPSYDPAAAFSPSLAATLRDIARMAPPVPPDATWQLFTKKPSEQQKQPWTKFPLRNPDDGAKTFSGWLCSETETDLVIIDYFAQTRTLPKSNWTATPETLSQTAQRLLDVRNTSPSRAEAMSQFAKQRSTPNPPPRPAETAAEQLSRGGNLTAQWEPEELSVPEALTAAWLFARDERADCAKLLFPRLEKLRDERWLRQIARDQIGRVLNEDMLEAFSYRRDYAATLALARRLADPVFDGYSYHDLAIDLTAQLERNPEDFRTLTLPTPDEWTRLKTTMPRDETIRYLAARLRLLNCIQRSQPGGISYDAPQYQPPFVGEVPEDKRVEVINPFNELLAMQPTAADLKLLLPYLAQRDFIPAFSFWRDFHPSRTLHQVDWVAGEIINRVAQRDLASPQKLNTPDESERAARIAEVARWCDEHASLSASGLVLNTLRTATDADEWLSTATLSTRQKPNDEAVEIICARANEFPKITEDTAKILYDSRSEKALPLARQWLSHADRDTRYWSALLVLTLDKEASKQEALQTLKKVLSEIDASKSQKQFGEGEGYMDWKDYYRMRYAAAIDPLLSSGVPSAKKLALDILQQPFFLSWEMFGAEEKGALLRRFLLAGYEEAYAFVQKSLNDDQPAMQFDNSGWNIQQGVPYEIYKTRLVSMKPFNTEWEGQRVTRQLHVYDYIADMAKYWRKDWKYETNAPEDVRRQKVAELKTWLAQQHEKIKRGEPSDFAPPPKLIRY